MLMKKVKYLIGIMCLICFSFVLGGCSSNDEEKPKLTFISEEGKEYYNFETSGNEIITLPMNPTKEGYNFKGWYLDKEYKLSFDQNYFKDKALEKDTNVYAKWELANYIITYELDGGINNNANPSEYNITTPTITLITPTKTGYNFLGWYKEATFENEVESIELGSTGNLTLHAKWEAISYTITYELDGGVNNNANPAGYTIATSTITLANPAKKGYNFLGWYKEATYDTNVTVIETEDMMNVVLYAKWEKAEYTITYELNGGKNYSDNPTGYNVTTPTITLVNPTKTGYNFLGWYKEATFENEVESIELGSTGNLTLHAKWQIINYSITYYLHGGTNNPNNPTYRNIENDTIILKDPTRDGYEFLGWYNDLEDEVLVSQINTGAGFITLHAKWEKVYTITYHMDEGVENPSSNPSTYKQTSKTIYLEEPVREGYIFKGWYTEAYYETQCNIIISGSSGNLDLYPKWQLIYYEINLDLDGGRLSSTPLTNYLYHVEYEKILEEPIKTGYEFLGWYTIDTDVKVEKIEKGTTGDINLIAKWKIINYTITYHLYGGTNSLDNPTEYNVNSETITIQDPVKEGYEFLGWYSNSNYSATASTTISNGSTGHKHLYAKWDVIMYAVTLDVNGGSLVSLTNYYYNVEYEGTIKIPTRTGYEFLGWYTTDTDVKVEKIERGTTGDISLIAKWKIINYTITYHLYGGTNSPDNPTEYNITSETITLQAPTKEGYEFLGWYTSEYYALDVTSIPTGSTLNRTLYARWAAIN